MGEPRHLPPGNEFALNTGRAAAVIKLAAEEAGWGKTLPKGRGMGLAFHFSHAGHFAEVAEVSVDANKKLTVHQVTVAGDVGPIINMSGAENQTEGAVIDGFSTMLGLSIGIENGRIQEKNFDHYPILRIANTPKVVVTSSKATTRRPASANLRCLRSHLRSQCDLCCNRPSREHAAAVEGRVYGLAR